MEEADDLAGENHGSDDVGRRTSGIYDYRSIHPGVAGVGHHRRALLGEHFGFHHEIIEWDRPVDPIGKPRRIDGWARKVGHPWAPGFRLDPGQYGPAEPAPLYELFTGTIDQLRRGWRRSEMPQSRIGVCEAPGMQSEVVVGYFRTERT